MAIIRWEPFRMEDFPEFRLPKFGNDMAVDVYEKAGKVIAEMHLPGVDADDIDVDVEDEYVRVSVAREDVTEKEEKDYYYKEIQRGAFERTFRLPDKVDPTKAVAEFEDGVLTLMMPIVAQKKTQTIKPTRKTKTELKKAPAAKAVKTTATKTKPSAKKK